MKKYLIVLLCLSLLCAPAFSASVSADDSIKVRVGIYENQPKIFTDAKGNASGFWPEILKYIASEERWTIAYVPGTWEQCLTRLKNGEIDIMPDVAYTEERSDLYDFSRETVYTSWSKVYARKGTDIQSILDLEGKNIAVLKGSVNVEGPEGIKRLVNAFHINCIYTELDSYTRVFGMVESGEADAGVVSKDFGNLHEADFNVVKTAIIFQPASLYFAFPKDSSLTPYLIERIDSHMRELKKDGNSIYYQSLGKWLGVKPLEKPVMPEWMIWTLAGIGGLALLLAGGSFVLRYQVRLRTKELVEEIAERKRAEEALRASEARFRNLVENAPVGITISTVDGGIVLRNKALQEIYGYPSMEEFMKSPPIERFYNREERQKFLESALSEQAKNIEMQMKRQDGTPFWASLTSIPHTLESGERALITVTQDITERKKAEEELKASEERFRNLVENVPVGIGLSTFSGRALFRNRTLFEMSGYTNEELTDTPIADRYVEPEDWRRLVELSKKGLVRDFETRLKHKNGSFYWVSFTSIPQKTELGDGYLAVSQDITRRKQAEEALRASEARYRTLVENVPVGISITMPDGKAIERNRAVTEMHGYTSREEFLKVPAQGRYYDIRDRERMLNLLKRGIVKDFEVQLKRRDGTPFWASLASIPYTLESGEKALITITQDITERKEAEELFRTLAESNPVGIFIIQDWKFQYVNRQFLSYTGYTADEIRDRDFDTIISPDDQDAARRTIVSTLKDSLVYLAPQEYRIVNKSGETRYALMMAAPITYQRKDAVIGSYIDITDYKNMERQVVEFKELDRMKTNLLSLVSHELRTPLSTIKGYTSLMLNYQSRLKENESREYLETMDKAADRLTGLVQHLLDMSRLDAGLLALNKAPTSISRLLRETVAEAKVRMPTHKFSLITDKRLPTMNIDATRIRQVVDNLVDNSRKYSAPGTEIEVHARRLKGEIIISVADHGVGIPASELPRIFDKMYRLERRLSPRAEGLGLGLPLCKGLVEAHGGRIWMESEEGKGSTGYFSLPLTKGASEQ